MAKIQKESRMMIIQLKKMLITLVVQNPEWGVFKGMDLRSNSMLSKHVILSILVTPFKLEKLVRLISYGKLILLMN